MNELEFWGRRLDELKSRMTPPTDAEVSHFIRVNSTMISQLRTGRREVPFLTKIKILEALGYVFDFDLLVRMLPADHRAAFCEVIARTGADLSSEIVSKNSGKELPPLPANS